VTAIGRITLVDPGRSAHPLHRLLEHEHAQADRTNAKLLLWVTAPGCGPCAGVAAALDDPRMQEALAGMRVVRLNVGVSPSVASAAVRASHIRCRRSENQRSAGDRQRCRWIRKGA